MYIFNRDLSLIQLDNFFGKGQSQACPAIALVAGLIHTVKGLKQKRLLVVGNPNPGVLDQNL